MAFLGNFDFAEMAPLLLENGIVLCKSLIEKGRVASNQIEETFVVPKDIVNEQLGFAAKSLPEIVIEVGKEP